MKDLEGVQFSMLYLVVKELAQKQLEEKQILLVRNLAQFARVNNALPTLDTAIYSIIYIFPFAWYTNARTSATA